MLNPLESCSIGELAANPIGATALPGVLKLGGIDGGGTGLMNELKLQLLELEAVEGLSKLLQEASLRFCRSLEGVEEVVIRWL